MQNNPTQASPVAPAADPSPAPEAPARKPRKKAEAPAEPDAPAPEAPKPAHAIDPTDDTPENIADPTAEDVRAAMDKVRQRIEGEDYKDNTDGEGYKTYHAALTKTFKAISKELSGQEKPSALPAELRKSFIDACAVITAADGKISA